MANIITKYTIAVFNTKFIKVIPLLKYSVFIMDNINKIYAEKCQLLHKLLTFYEILYYNSPVSILRRDICQSPPFYCFVKIGRKTDFHFIKKRSHNMRSLMCFLKIIKQKYLRLFKYPEGLF